MADERMDTFMRAFTRAVDSGKLAKATTMLRADRFQLYADLDGDALIGVVKSQNDPGLVYSCRLTKDGDFACCTQNLNACGGLRGSLCKHLLVLVVGLVKAGTLDADTALAWARASKSKRPVLDKDRMSTTFVKHKGAEAGEVDWRPTETLPEDFYAY
ncbi:MAG: hypothetical protein ABMB14_06105 [Myxococcota bacterium]